MFTDGHHPLILAFYDCCSLPLIQGKQGPSGYSSLPMYRASNFAAEQPDPQGTLGARRCPYPTYIRTTCKPRRSLHTPVLVVHRPVPSGPHHLCSWERPWPRTVAAYVSPLLPLSSLRRWLGAPREMICSMSDGRLCFRMDGRGVCRALLEYRSGRGKGSSLLTLFSSGPARRGVATTRGTGYPEPGGLCGKGILARRERAS